MSIYLQIDDNDSEFLASNTGYFELEDWIRTLPPEFTQLHQLRSDGSCKRGEPADLLQTVAQARQAFPPSKNVEGILDTLAEEIGFRPEGIWVAITDGMISGPPSEDDEDYEEYLQALEDEKEEEEPSPEGGGSAASS